MKSMNRPECDRYRVYIGTWQVIKALRQAGFGEEEQKAMLDAMNKGDFRRIVFVQDTTNYNYGED